MDTSQALGNDLKYGIETMLNDLQSDHNVTLKQLLQTGMNLLMVAERQLHLQQQPHDKGNGYFERKLGTPLGELNLKVPRDRDGDFRPASLPQPHQRDFQERAKFMEALLLSGYSPKAIQNSLRQLGMHYNPEELEQLKEEYYTCFQQWQKRELPHDVMGLFVDVYNAPSLVQDKVKKTAIYVIVGIDFEGKKSLFGIYDYVGQESKGFWLQTLNQVISRGVKCPLMVVSDDFPGLKEAIATLFPKTLHQLCFIHMQRNVRRNMAEDDASVFNETLKKLKLGDDPAQAQKEFEGLCERYQTHYPMFIKALKADSENYFAFMHLPREVHKYFYTTNLVESVNSILEKIRQKQGGFFQSESSVKVNVFITFKRLGEEKWQQGVPKLKSQLYGIRQVFAQRYDRLPEV